MIVHQLHNTGGNHNYNAFFYTDCQWYHHFHKNYEAAYVLEGEVELTLNGTIHHLGPDTFALILPNEFHAYHTPVSSRVWIGVFSADFVGSFAKITESKQADTPLFSCRPQIREFLLHTLITENRPDILLLKSALYALCSEFLNQVTLRDAVSEKGFVYDIVSYVAENYQTDITLTTIADKFGYEYHYLSRQFHNYFHMHFKQFLNIYRTDCAQDQLLHTKYSITDIALNAGFQNLRTFNRVFLVQTGMTPTEFRRSRQLNQPVMYPAQPLP